MPGGNKRSERAAKKSGIGGGIIVEFNNDDMESLSSASTSYVSTFDGLEFRKCHGEFVNSLKIKHLYPLVGEVDRCLKKVGEGLETVEDVWEKFMAATVASQKEKYEGELKKEIKKLQRLREQIKSWIALADIKDKTMLHNTKRLIETQMERFKEIEREMKIKTYSKVGLESEQKVDPMVKEAEQINAWIASSIERLGIQIDHLESEIEAVTCDKKRRNQHEEISRLEKLQSDIDRHRFHIDKLETLMKMLDDLASDVNYNVCRLKKFLGQVKKIQEDVNYYIESSQEPDFEHNEYIYSDIDGMEEFEQCLATSSYLSTAGHDDTGIGSNTSETNPPSPSAPLDTIVDVPCERSVSKTEVPNKTSQVNGFGPSIEAPAKIIRAFTGDSSQRELQSSFKDVVARTSVPSVQQNGSTTVPTATASNSASKVPKSSGSKSSGGRNRSSSHVVITHRKKEPKTKKSASHSGSKATKRNASSSEKSMPISDVPVPPQRRKENGKPVTYSGAVAISCENDLSKLVKETGTRRDENGNDCEAGPVKRVPTPVIVNGSGLTCHSFESQSLPDFDCSESRSGQVSPDLAVEDDYDSFEGEVPVSNSTPTPMFEVHDDEDGSIPKTKEAMVPPLLAVAPLGQAPLSGDHIHQYQMLEGSQRKLQTSGMLLYSPLEPCGQLLPRHSYASPSYYPQWPLTHMGTNKFYEKLTVETLFFIFYYSGKSKAQYMAAKELKRQMWRFHKRDLTWFQRCDQPEVTTDEYEVGNYFYFDVDEWAQKKKTFTFEYKYLEDIEL